MSYSNTRNVQLSALNERIEYSSLKIRRDKVVANPESSECFLREVSHGEQSGGSLAVIVQDVESDALDSGIVE